MTPGSFDQLWHLLGRAREYRVQVFGPDGELRHRGVGQIIVEAGDSRIAWRESGRWERGSLAGIRFHNSTTWERNAGAALSVQHLRRGIDQPTFLAHLEPSGEAEWRSVGPHLCGEDRYHARIWVAGESVEIGWTVESPSDPYSLRTTVHR